MKTWIVACTGVLFVGTLMVVGMYLFIVILSAAMTVEPRTAPMALLAGGCFLLAWLIFRIIPRNLPRFWK